MNKQTTSDEILNKLYAAYGTDSGILFGIKEMDIVKAIVNFTLDYSHPQTETKVEDVQVGRDILDEFIEAIKSEFKDQNWDYLDFIAERVRAKAIINQIDNK